MFVYRLVDALGARVIGMAGHANAIATIIGYALYRLTLGVKGINRETWRVLTKQIMFSGVDALTFVTWIAFLTAATVVFQAHVLVEFGQQDLLGKLLVSTVLRELGPLMCAVILIGRSGTAVAAELGNMQVNGEIDTLEAMGVDPFEYLVVPRLAGMMVSLFALSVFFVFFSLAGGYLMGALWTPGAPTASEFCWILTKHLTVWDMPLFLAKTLIPGLMIAAINCHEGFAVSGDVTEVPRAASRGVVRAVSTVFFWNALMTALFYLLQE
jgi:phospholipid/cholesterol/gamma-HCH transport system permease protein